MTLYTYRTGDDVCTPFATDDPDYLASCLLAGCDDVRGAK